MHRGQFQLLAGIAAALALTGAALAAANFMRTPAVIGDPKSGLQFALAPPWKIVKSLGISKSTPHLTSGTRISCDIDTCSEPAQVSIMTGPVGDLLDDERYGHDGSLDNERAFKRIFERLEGIRMPDNVQRIQLGDLYGFRTISMAPNQYGQLHPVAGDFFIRGRDLIAIGVGLMTTRSTRDESHAIKVLDALRTRLRVDGKPVSN